MTSGLLGGDFGLGWTLVSRRPTASGVTVVVEHGGHRSSVTVARAAAGDLSCAYPVSDTDWQVVVYPVDPADALQELLVTVVGQILTHDPGCRRVVYAAPTGRPDLVAAAERAGLRHVVDVETAAGEFELMVAEPGWVTSVDMDLDRVPGT